MWGRDWSDRIRDLLEVIEEIQSFRAGMTYQEFERDARTRKAVSANFAILGEAAGHVPPDITGANPEIPWSVMKAMRNRVVHAYFAVDPAILWDTIQNDLPPLIEPLERILAEERAGKEGEDEIPDGPQ